MAKSLTHYSATAVPAKWSDVHVKPRVASLSMEIEMALQIGWDENEELRRLMETIDHESSVEGRWQIDEFRVAEILREIAKETNRGLDQLRGARLDRVIQTLRRLTKARIPALCRRLRFVAARDEATANALPTPFAE